MGHVRTLFANLNLLRPDTTKFPELTRFACHLNLCFQFMSMYITHDTNTSQNDSMASHENNTIVTKYIKHLIQRQQYSMVAMYVEN